MRPGDLLLSERAEPVLLTERTWLRPFAPSDLAFLTALHFDPEVMRYLAWGVRTDAKQVERDLERFIRHQTEHGYGKWVVCERASGEPIGRAGLVNLDDGDIDLGYTLKRSHWGRGLATEVARGLRGWGEKHLPDPGRMVGIVHPHNPASARVLEKIGFRFSEESEHWGDKFRVYRL